MAAPSSVRLVVAQKVLDALKAISVADGYNSNAVCVMGVPEMDGIGSTPHYAVIPGPDVQTSDDVPLCGARPFEMAMSVLVFGAVKADAERSVEMIETMIADVRRALAIGISPMKIGDYGEVVRVSLGSCRPSYNLAQAAGVVGFTQSVEVVYRAIFQEV